MDFLSPLFSNTRATVRGFLHAPLAHPVLLALLLLGVAAAGLDAYTTLAMMGSGLYEEANPLAAHGMGSIGTEWYVAGATVVSLALTLLIFVRGRNHLWLALPAFGVLFVCYKAYTGLSNLVLWWA